MQTSRSVLLSCAVLTIAFACSPGDPPSPQPSGGDAGSAGGAGGSASAGASGATSTADGSLGATGGGPSGAGGAAAGNGGASAGQGGSAAGQPSTGTAEASSTDAARARDAAAEAPSVATGGCGTAKVCDDFESYALVGPIAPWTTAVAGGSLKIDATHVWSGKQAMLVHADAGANRRAQLLRTGGPLFPAEPNLLWGRMMVYATNLPPSTVHYDNIQADGTGTGQYRIGGMGGILLNYEPHDCYQHIATPIPQNKWACWQWLYDGSRNTIEFYVDGVLQTKVNGTGQGCVDGTMSTWAAPTFNAVRLGWVNYQAMPAAVDLWIDDVALGAERVACPAAGDMPR